MTSTIKKLVVLGSTGSIGRQTLDVVRAHPDRFRIIGLAAGGNTELLQKQAAEFKPDHICYRLGDGQAIDSKGKDSFLPMEQMSVLPEADVIVAATSGMAGLRPVLAAVQAGKTVALANKESLVMTGQLMMEAARKSGAAILPVDSEHSAIWQCLSGPHEQVARILLTASGGPFRGFKQNQLFTVTAENALKHPSWQMGPKVTIDSATLMNKGLEVIEAHWLFDIDYDNIEVVVHPQSFIHSMVEYIDGSVIAQLSQPDMRLPIQYALSYPERLTNPRGRRFNWQEMKNLDFEQPDVKAFPCLDIAREAGRQGGTYPTALCAADEVAVDLFLKGAIPFTDIPRLVQATLDKHQNVSKPGIEDVFDADTRSRETASGLSGRLAQ